MTAQVGRKYDADKPWAGTVLAGFWCDAVEHEFRKGALSDNGIDPDGDYANRICSTLKLLFDTRLPVSRRLLNARNGYDGTDDDASCTSLYASEMLPGAVRVGTYGARKYERDNWLHVEDGINRYYEAAGRHVLQILEDKWIDTPDDPNDKGSGLANLDHICWCIFAGAKLVDNLEQKEGQS